MKKFLFILLIIGLLIGGYIILDTKTVLFYVSSYPDLEINGPKEITLYIGDEYIEQGATAITRMGKDISDSIKISGTVDTSKMGRYEIRYSAEDNITLFAGLKDNYTERVRVVNVAMKDIGDIIKDKGFQKLIVLTVKKPLEDITLKDLNRIDVLGADNISNIGIKSLEGINNMSGLREIRLPRQEIEFIPKIESVHIEVIKLNSNNITDLDWLNDMAFYKEIELSNNKITDVSGLKGVDVKKLYLRGNEISDISAFSKVIAKKIDLCSNQITNIYPLREMAEQKYFETTEILILDNPIDEKIQDNRFTIKYYKDRGIKLIVD